ncbi:MAG: hypothetical protein EA391_14295 [Balneolaceae bacterium]|nr:MAG: hypothetical protein EA391_14295 [Balneolaceae bacterium]
MTNSRIMKNTIYLLPFLFLMALPTMAQQPDMYVAVHEEEQAAYIYHFLTPALGNGVLVYRSIEGAEFELLTDEPVMPVNRAADMEQQLGPELFDEIQTFLNRDDAQGTFFALRTNREVNRFLTVFRPEVADLLGRRFIDREAPIGSEVTYRVQIVNDRGTEIGDPVEHTALLEVVTPQEPRNVAAHQDEGFIEIGWNYPRETGNRPDDVIAFRVLMQREGEQSPSHAHANPVARDSNQDSFTYRIPLPEPGVELTFWVEAIDIIRQSTRSSENAVVQAIDPTPPPMVRGVRGLFQTDHDVALSWFQSPDPRVTGYLVYRAVDSHSNYDLITDEPLPVDDPFFRDTVPDDRRYYFYRVSAVNEWGTEGEWSNFTSIFVPDRTPPSPPQNLVATYNEANDTVELTWEDDDPAPDLLTYLVIRRIEVPGAEISYSQINHDNLIDFSFTDLGIAGEGFIEGAFYNYGIAVADSSQNISDTLYVDLQIPGLTLPNAPGQLTARTNGRQVSLVWSQSLSGDVVNYRITRTGEQQDDSFEKMLPRHQIRYIDRDVQRGATYRYEVAAVDSFDNVSLNPPAQEILVADGNRPPIVRNVHLVPSGNGVVELRWAGVRSGNLAGYRIYRSEISTTGYELVAEVDAGSEVWEDEISDQRLWYRIRAFDEFGNVSMPSQPVRLRQ